MMTSMISMNGQAMKFAAQLAEDAGAPELRNPLNSGMRAKGLRERLFCHESRAVERRDGLSRKEKTRLVAAARV